MEDTILMETERLILRRYREEDYEDLYEYLSDPEVVKFEPYRPMDREETGRELAFRIADAEMIAVELKSTGKLIGNVYLGKREFDALEMGYVFNRKFWGLGYASESFWALIRWAFDRGIHRIYAECDPENENSWKLLERMGFAREGHLKENVWFRKDENGRPLWKDTYIYAIGSR